MFDSALFGERIQFYRNEKGLTLEKLSELADISYNYLSEIEHGKHTPTLQTIVSILNALNISYVQLINSADYEKILNESIIKKLTLLNEKELDFMLVLLKNYNRNFL